MRKGERFREAPDLIRGALRRDPARVGEWRKTLPENAEVVVDPEAEFLYVPTPEVKNIARDRQAVPYDIPDVEFSHEGELCSFDAFLKFYRLKDPALEELARIVRGADTGKHELTPQSPGLLAISLGLSLNFNDDLEMLEHGMVMYDALYSWCKRGKEEKHTWNPDLYR